MTQQSTEHKERFTFSSKALAGDSCKVLRFSGTEGLHSLYSFEIILVCQEFIDIDSFIVAPCTLHIARKDDDSVQFHGYPTSCTQNSHSHGWTFYTVQMMPHFSQLRGIVHNAIHVDADVQEIVQESLGHCALMAPEHVFQLQKSYPKQDFSMQYNEDMYAYICYYLERYGIYYYFDQQGEREKVIFTDEPLQHMPIVGEKVLTYSPTSGLESLYLDEIIFSFNKVQIPLPKNVHLRDYDWKNPNAPLEATALVSEKGHGDLFFYGDGFTSVKEGKRLATIRAEALRCQGTTFQGLSSVPRMSPGYLFTLDEHFDQSCNGDFLITQVQHQGSQEAHLSMVLGIRLENPADTVYYRNTFTCIKKEVPFRAPHHTERKKISGMIHAFIDASTDNSTPEIDEFGRYKVLFPQDISGRGAGKASCWLRRAQPSVGVRYGTSFPLDPGVEVLIAFSDGNPDRPFIAAALANAETGSMDSSSRALFSGVSTAGGGGLLFNDQAEKQGFNLSTGSMRSGLMMASGSLDSTILQSDFLNIVSSMSTSSSSSLKSSLSSRLKAEISVDGKPTKISYLILTLLETLAHAQILAQIYSLVTTPSENPYDVATISKHHTFKENMTALGMNGLEVTDAIKAFDFITLAAHFDTVPQSPYITKLHAKENAGELSLLAPLTGAHRQFLFAETFSHMFTKALLVTAGSRAQAKEVQEDKSSEKLDQERTALKQKMTEYYTKENPKITQAELEKHYTHYTNYLKEKKISRQIRNWSTQLASLISEFASFLLLTKMPQDASSFGGIKINAYEEKKGPIQALDVAEEKQNQTLNMVIHSATGTHISSDSHIALIAGQKQAHNVDAKPARTLLKKDKKICTNMGLKDTKPVVFGQANGIGFSAHEKMLIKGTGVSFVAGEPQNAAKTLGEKEGLHMHVAKNIQLQATKNITQNAKKQSTLKAEKQLNLFTKQLHQHTEKDVTIAAGKNLNINAEGHLDFSSEALMKIHITSDLAAQGTWGKVQGKNGGMNIQSQTSLLSIKANGVVDVN